MKDEKLGSLRILLWNTNLLASKNLLSGWLGISQVLILLLLYSQYIWVGGGTKRVRGKERKKGLERKKN